MSHLKMIGGQNLNLSTKYNPDGCQLDIVSALDNVKHKSDPSLPRRPIGKLVSLN
jgi:hypothetical protein